MMTTPYSAPLPRPSAQTGAPADAEGTRSVQKFVLRMVLGATVYAAASAVLADPSAFMNAQGVLRVAAFWHSP